MDITYKTENSLIAFLKNQSATIGAMNVYGTKGDSPTTLPFIFVTVTKATELVNGTNAFKVEGVIQLVSEIYDTPTAVHQTLLDAIKPVLDTLWQNCPWVDTANQVAWSGIDVGSLQSRDSTADKAHADIWTFNAGVSG